VARPSARRRDLAAYDAKRDFARTPEPAGARPAASAEGAEGGLFVVQRHRARALHYDLRLEIDGVLASWAVPKGPTLDPAARGLAVHVEDHPMEYADFEGVIPAGEYGGGDVIVWDRGTWTPSGTDDPAAAVAAGELHFDLAGEKLAGRFVLVRTRTDARGREQWLLLHKRDDAAVPGWSPEDHPESVKSGRTNDEVREAPDALWRSDLPADEAEVPVARPTGRDGGAPGGSRRGARRARRPVAGPSAAELGRLDRLGDGGRWQVGGHRVPLAGLDDAVATPRGEEPLTVRDLVRYHAVAAPLMAPYLADRRVEVRRFPAGLGGRGEDAGDLAARAPRWVGRRDGAADGEGVLELDGVAALAWVAGERGVELRPAVSTLDLPGAPTWVVVGVEPGATTAPADLALVGRLLGTALDHLGLVGGVRIDGRGGLEVWVPVTPVGSFPTAQAWAASLAATVATSVPELVGADPSARRRGERIRLVPRQRRDRPPVVPFGIVALRDAPVAVPLGWDELEDSAAIPRWTLRNVAARLAEAGDPWADLIGSDQVLPAL
jgi:bifunctional non-homologous end joining protein LigD